jgi:putative transposase
MQARLRATETLDEIPKGQRLPVPQSLQAFAEAYSDQRTAMAAAYVSGAYTMKVIAAYFGVHYSPVSRAVSRAAPQHTAEPLCMTARPEHPAAPVS